MMKMKRCLIVTGGTIDIAFAKDFLSQRSYDYVIAADAGLEVLRPLHISPNAVVGDLDTVDKKVLEEYQNQPDIEFEIHKPGKGAPPGIPGTLWCKGRRPSAGKG